MARKKILWLCSWYPNRTDPYDGDFIQRHARAASLFHDIQVIRVVADAALKPGVIETVNTTQTHLSEQIIYLGKGSGLAGRFRCGCMCCATPSISAARRAGPMA